jgi:hypothetical protein
MYRRHAAIIRRLTDTVLVCISTSYRSRYGVLGSDEPLAVGYVFAIDLALQAEREREHLVVEIRCRPAPNHSIWRSAAWPASLPPGPARYPRGGGAATGAAVGAGSWTTWLCLVDHVYVVETRVLPTAVR